MLKKCMIEFAKLHVAAALNEAALNSILNAYPLTKIK